MEIHAKYTDTNLSSVRQYVNTKNSSVPFLLLPVRIETRFMQVERADLTFTNPHVVGEMLEILYDIETGFFEYQTKIGLSDQQRLIQLTTQKIDKVKVIAKKLGKITKEQKTWLTDSVNAVNKEGKELAKNLSRLFSVKLNAELMTLQSLAVAIDASAPTKTEKSLSFIKEMIALEEKLAVFTSNKTPYTSKGNKKKLYQFVTGRIAEAKHFYKYSIDKVESIFFIEENLVEKVSALHRKITSHLLHMGTALKKFHHDENWVNFVDANSYIIKNEYSKLFNNFETTAIAHLSEVQKLDVVDANKFLVQSLAMNRAYKKFSKLDVTSYGEIKKMRKHLNGKINILKKLETKVIGGNDIQKDQITRQLAAIEENNKILNKKLQNSNFGNNSIKFGVQATKKLLSEVAEVSHTNASKAKITTRSDIFNGSKTMTRSLQNFELMAKNFGGNNRIGNFQNKKIDSILNDTKVALRKGYQISTSDYHKLNEQLLQIKEKSEHANYETIEIKRENHSKIASLEELIKDVKNHVLVVGKDPGIQFVVPKKLKDELWLRIFPDDIFVNTHEKAMTQGELDSGKRYWKIVWAVNNDKELVLGAWKSMVASYGNSRAAWIAKTVGAAKIRRNKRIIFYSPSKEIIKVITELEEVQTLLNGITSDFALKDLNQKVNFPKIIQLLSSATLTYKRLKNKPQLIYFLEKNVSIQQRIHSKFQIVVSIINQAVASVDNQMIVNSIQNVLNSFELAHKEFVAIKTVRTDQFLDLLTDPYQYQDIAAMEAKENAWTEAPHTKVLPKQFVAIGRNNNKFEIIHVGKPILDQLQLGMNPSTFDFKNETDNPFQLDSEGNLKVEEGMRWMVDFDEAVKKGMGMIVPLTTVQAKDGFDELYVLGLNDTSFLNDATKLEELLENHHYSPNGLEFLKIGTATNNTEDVKAGFSHEQMSAEDSFALEMEAPLFDSTSVADKFNTYDGMYLADYLGISNKNFNHIKNSNLKQIGNAHAMHKSLWHATMGVYMDDMWDKVFTYDNIERTYQFFTDNVIGRGALPSIRIGSQPYGILPVTSFKTMTFSNTFSEDELPTLKVPDPKNPNRDTLKERLQFRYDVRLKQLLNIGNDIWSSLRIAHVKHAGNFGEKGDPQANFVTMLGLTATSTEFYFRYGVNINDRTADNLARVGVVINGPMDENLENGNINFKDNEEEIYSPQNLIGYFNKLLEEGYFSPSYALYDETNPSLIPHVQKTTINSRIRDQINASRIFTYRYLDRHSLVGGEMVSEVENDQALPIVKDSKNYIQWLLDPAKHVYRDLFKGNDVANLPSQSVLFLLLRQSMLLSYRETALNILQNEGFFDEPFRRIIGSKETYMSPYWRRYGIIFSTKWTHLLKRMEDLDDPFYFQPINSKPISKQRFYEFLTQGSRNESVSDYIQNESLRILYSGSANHTEFINRTKDIKEAMGHLADVATEDLSALLSEHLDVSSYRLDAWISGFANKRLKESRAIQKTGVFLGAYAWVENLRPGGDRAEVTEIPEGLVKQGEAVYKDEDNEGYIHAPSINHAISAAILRSGYLANDDAEGNLTNRMAVNLTSARVRKAMQLIDGLRNGLDLPSLLGYQFEKGIHERFQEAELDKFIYPLRQRYPLIVPIPYDNQPLPNENQATANVVHGLNLLEAITDTIKDSLDPSDPAGSSEVSQSSLYNYLTEANFKNCPTWLKQFVKDHSKSSALEQDKELTALIREIDQMADTFDALGDVAISESVYQIVNGNHVRAASMLAALGDGTLMPEPQIINTPRTGTVVTHKVILNFEEAFGLPENWGSILTPRSAAEPSLNHWLANEIGNPELVICRVIDTENSNEFIIKLSELDLQPIDLLFLLSSNKDKGNADLIDLIMVTTRKLKRLKPSINLTVDINTKDKLWPKNAKGFSDLDWLLSQCKSILHDARPITFSDISIPVDNPEVDNPEKYDLGQLQSRINQIHGDFKQFLNVLKDFLMVNTSPVSLTTFHKAYQHLNQALQYSITSLLVDLKFDFAEEESKLCIDRLNKVVELLEKRATIVDVCLAKAALAITTQQKAEELIKIPKAILGEDFPFMPAFKNELKSDIQKQLDLPNSQSLLRASICTFPMEEWLQSIANVRSKLYSVEMLSLSQNIESVGIANLKPVQFPYNDNDYWLGIEYPEAYQPKDDKLSLVLLNPSKAIDADLQRGLLIDEWVEVIPNNEETTGIAFQYDQPDSTPPQTILLAVSPKPVTATSKWEWDDLVYTLMDTLELAKNRTVEPDQLENSTLGQVLPALISEVVPSQLRDQSDPEPGFDPDPDVAHKNLLGVQVVLDYEANLPNEDE